MMAANLPTQRQLRVGEEIRRAMVQILAEGSFRDPALQNVSITVSEVRPAGDLKTVKAFVYPLGGESPEAVLKSLNRASAYVRGQLGKIIRLKFTPKITFLLDQSFDMASAVNDMLQDVRVTQDLESDLGPPADGA